MISTRLNMSYFYLMFYVKPSRPISDYSELLVHE